MTAVETLLAGLFDYAGLYPPASLDMQTAVRNYLRYSQSAHREALGRFVVSADRIGEVRSAAAESFSEMKLSLLVAADVNLGSLTELLAEAGRVTLEWWTTTSRSHCALKNCWMRSRSVGRARSCAWVV